MEGNQENQHRPGTATIGTIASLVSGFLLLTVGFFAGWYWQNSTTQDLVKVEIVEKSSPQPAQMVQNTATPELEEETQEIVSDNCAFIGSKNSDKYHSPDSAPAKRILPENRVCFESIEEALDEGYEEGTI